MRTVREGNFGKNLLRLVEHKEKFTGLAFNAADTEIARVSGSNLDTVWMQLHSAVSEADPRYFGYDGAIARFKRIFSRGFHSKEFVEKERTYKLDAKTLLEADAPLVSIKDGSGFGETALAAFRATNLLSPYEKVKLQEPLRGKEGDSIVKAIARFAGGDMQSLAELDYLLRPYDSAKWTVVTYLPFLWAPDRHMFLKPEVTKDFASRVGHAFSEVYRSALSVEVYDCLLDLVARTTKEVATLKPRDFIDIQSFIWVVSEYDETIV